MSFPVYLQLGPWQLHPHIFFELLAYSLGFQLWRLRQQGQADQRPMIDSGSRLWLLVAVVLGAAGGARLLGWLESPWDAATGQWLMPGKTIAGGLLGGWAGVELAKRKLGITLRTGDTYVLPLCAGIALGRLGCFLTGLDDHTFGQVSSLPWAVDFGDGLPRHPTQLYEAAFVLALLPAGAALKSWRAWPAGAAFQGFIASYCAFRFGVEWIKPTMKIYLGMSAIQWAVLIGFAVAAGQIRALLRQAGSDTGQTEGEPADPPLAPA